MTENPNITTLRESANDARKSLINWEDYPAKQRIDAIVIRKRNERLARKRQLWLDLAVALCGILALILMVIFGCK